MNDTTNPTTITAPVGLPFIEVVRDFDAPPALVFRASTDPELVVQWLGPYDMAMEIVNYDAVAGGSYRYIHRHPERGEHAFHGVFHSVVQDELIIQTFEYEGAPGQVSLDSYTFSEIDGGRTRVVTRSILPSVEARDAALASGMERGINDSMNRLDDLLQRLD
jgi:uncharacterized protein YndB with AHSA1/START domain